MSRVFVVLLLASLPLAAETLSFSPEQPIGLPTPGPAAAAQDDPGAASNGDGFLIAWTQSSQGDDVYAARVSTLGEVLDPSGIPVATLGTGERLLDVFADGRGSLVVWQTAQGVSYAAVDEEGAVGPATLLVPDFLVFGVVGWDGGEFVIVESYGGEIVTRHVGRDGVLLSRTVTSGPDAFVWDVTEAPGGAVGILSDTRTHEYYLARLEGHAAPVITALGGGDVGAPRLSVSPGSILVTGRGSNGTVHAFLSDVEVTSVRALSFPAPSSVDYPLGAVGTATGHRVYTMSGAELRLHEIDDDGIVETLTDPLQLIEGRLRAVGSSGACDLLAFVPPIPVSGWEPVVRGVVVRDRGAELVRGGEALVWTAAVQETPLVAGGGEGHVALWSERRSVLAEATQWSAAMSAEGRASPAVPVPIACQAMAFDGLHRVALCREAEDALGFRRVSPDGVVDGVPYATVAVAPWASEPQLACGDGSCLTGWEEGAVVELALMSSSGALISRLATPGIAGLGRGVRDIRLAFHDGVYLVAWSQIMNVSAPPWWREPLDLYAVRVDERGALIDLAPFVVAGTEDDERGAAAAGGGGAFVVVWSRGSSILGTRIPTGSSPVETEASHLVEGGSPTIARFRSGFLVAWEQGNPSVGAESRDIAVGVLTDTGPLLLRGETIAARRSSNEFGPVIDAGEDRALLLYHRVAHDQGIGGVARIYARAVTLSTRMRPVRR